MIDYIELIADFYPDTICYTTGDSTDYSSIVWETIPIAQTELDTVYLTKYKTDKIMIFSENARIDIEQGFESSALGFKHWYDAQPEDQLNLIGSVASSSDMYYACRPYTRPYQVIDCGGLATGTRATGLANDTTVYNAEIVVNGVSSYISITGNIAQTYDDLLLEVNNDLQLTVDATMVIENGNLVLYGNQYGSTETVNIIDSSFGAAMTDYIKIDPPVAGTDGNTNGLKEYKLHTHTNLLTVINDGKNVKLFILQKFNVKKDQILAAADITAVDAITW